jgi:hypothetical protein
MARPTNRAETVGAYQSIVDGLACAVVSTRQVEKLVWVKFAGFRSSSVTCGRESAKACGEGNHTIETCQRPTYWIRYYRDGKRDEESAHTDKYDVAREILKEREGDVSRGPR